MATCAPGCVRTVAELVLDVIECKRSVAAAALAAGDAAGARNALRGSVIANVPAAHIAQAKVVWRAKASMKVGDQTHGDGRQR